MKDRMGWTVLYLNRATADLYEIMRQDAPPGLRLLFLDSARPEEVREKLAQADAILIADSHPPGPLPRRNG